MPFYDDGKIVKSKQSQSSNKLVLDPSDAMIFCSNGEWYICQVDDYFRLVICPRSSSQKIKTIINEFKVNNIEILDYDILKPANYDASEDYKRREVIIEAFIDFKHEDIAKVCGIKIIRATKQRKKIIGLANTTDNYKLFLRTWRNYHSSYGETLNKLYGGEGK